MPELFLKKGKRIVLLAGLIVLLNVILYHRSLDYFFVMDDFYFMNQAQGETASRLLSDTIHLRPTQFRQLHHLTFFIYLRMMRSLFGLNAFYYHLSNLAIFIADCLLIYLLFLRISRDDILSFLTSLVFSTRAAQFLLIYWVAHFPDLLMIFFSVLSFLFYVSYTENKRRVFIIACFITFLLGACSKEFGILTPILMASYSVMLRGERSAKQLLRRFLPFALAMGLLLYFVLKPSAPENAGEIYRMSFDVRDMIRSFQTYLSHWFNPTNIFHIFESDYKPLAEAAFFSIGFVYVFFRRRQIMSNAREIAFGIVWWFIGLIPVLPLSHHIFPQLTGFASVGLSFAVARIVRTEGDSRKWVIPICMVIIIALSYSCTLNQERGHGPGVLMTGSYITRNLLLDASNLLAKHPPVEKIVLVNKTAFTDEFLQMLLIPEESFELFTGKRYDVSFVGENNVPPAQTGALLLLIESGPKGPRVVPHI